MRKASENATFVWRSYRIANAASSFSATSCIKSSSARRLRLAEADSAERLYLIISDIDTGAGGGADQNPHTPYFGHSTSNPRHVSRFYEGFQNWAVPDSARSTMPPAHPHNAKKG